MPEEKEMIDQPGLVSVEKELFMPEAGEEVVTEEGVAAEATPEAGDQPAATEVTPPVAAEVIPEVKPEGVQVVEPEKQPAGQVTPPESTRLFADKYKTEEELRHAFINLGGNPNRYTTVEKLEEAYEVRQQEFTRSRQEMQERDRINRNIETGATPNPTGNPLDSEALLDKVNWDKVENARDLGRELIAIMSQIAPKNEPNLPSEQEIVERIMPVMREREERINELHAIETDIPRLRVVPGQENEFRNAFAERVLRDKKSGSYISLKKSMESFLNFGKSIADEASRQTGIQSEAKVDAAPLSDRGAGLPTGGPTDMIDEIIGSFKARKDKLGEL